MMKENAHLSDQQLLLKLEGELSGSTEKLVRAHLDACWMCRARCQELDDTISGVARAYQSEFRGKLPPIAGPRALLKARLREVSDNRGRGESSWLAFRSGFARAMPACLCGLVLLGLFLFRAGVAWREPGHSGELTVSSPNPALTPGATLLTNRGAVCAQANVKNRSVPAALQRAVFQEYGLEGADPRAYEVDYLVTPALGGAEDIHNLWPHSYSSTEWNAKVKDALEDRLRELVCDGAVDLTVAQREIATNWIAAYKKYFRTDEPLTRPGNGGQ